LSPPKNLLAVRQKNEKRLKMETFGKKIIRFNKELNFKGELQNGIQVMNPFKENDEILSIIDSFYNKFYNDHKKRRKLKLIKKFANTS